MHQTKLRKDLLDSSLFFLNGHIFRKAKSSGEKECLADGGGRRVDVGLEDM